MPIVLATQDAEVGGSIEPDYGQRLRWGNRARPLFFFKEKKPSMLVLRNKSWEKEDWVLGLVLLLSGEL